jgi:Tol biopolymer transport system component
MLTHRFALAAFCCTLAAQAAAAQEAHSETRLTTEHYFDLERVSAPQISPDGAHIIYTRKHANKLEDRWESNIWMVNADGSRHRFLAKGSSPRWSADGKQILYLANARWSPDDKWIAFSMFIPRKNTWTISMPPEP